MIGITPYFLAAIAIVCSFSGTSPAADTPLPAGDAAHRSLQRLVEQELPSLLAVYKTLHAAPELSRQEEKTSAFVAKELRSLGYTVTERVGKYPDLPAKAYGVVAMMKNGAGPTVLIRADMDALPVTEETGLPYASTVRAKNDDGQDVGVMHACGHDMHTTVMLGTARMLAKLKDDWHGTVMLIAQPAEEKGGGAAAMLRDGLYERWPKPDYALSLHLTPALEAGTVGHVAGYRNADTARAEIIVRGVGGHGASPEKAKDPIVIAAQLILALQTIVSRETSPFDPAVVTVGSIHGGTASNIIPEEVRLELTIRTRDKKVRQAVFASIERMAKGVTLTGGVPEDRSPIVRFHLGHPANYNDPGLTARIARAMARELGAASVREAKPSMGGEDFGLLGLDGQIPTCMFSLGGADPTAFQQSQRSGIPLPSLHSSRMAPLPEPTLRAGVRAMTAAALDRFEMTSSK